MATTSLDQAKVLYGALCANFDELITRINAGDKPAIDRSPRAYAEKYLDHLHRLRTRGAYTDGALDSVAHKLDRILNETCIGALADIRDIRPRKVTKMIEELSDLERAHPKPVPAGLSAAERDRFNKLSPTTVRSFCMALSGMITYAKEEEDYVSENPIARHRDLPSAAPAKEARWFEVEQVAAMLEQLAHRRPHWSNPYQYEVIATFFYTGGRKNEVLQLAPEDVDLARSVVRLGNSKAHRLSRGRAPAIREVPLWPRLRGILTAFARREGIELGVENPRRPFLFPSVRMEATGRPVPMQEIGAILNGMSRAAGLSGDEYTHMTRHTYASVRLTMMETTSDGRLCPVSVYRVAQELGHQKINVLLTTYAHALRSRSLLTAELDYAAMAMTVERGGFRPPEAA